MTLQVRQGGRAFNPGEGTREPVPRLLPSFESSCLWSAEMCRASHPSSFSPLWTNKPSTSCLPDPPSQFHDTDMGRMCGPAYAGMHIEDLEYSDLPPVRQCVAPSTAAAATDAIGKAATAAPPEAVMSGERVWWLCTIVASRTHCLLELCCASSCTFVCSRPALHVCVMQ